MLGNDARGMTHRSMYTNIVFVPAVFCYLFRNAKYRFMLFTLHNEQNNVLVVV